MLVEMVQILFTKPYSLQYFVFLLFRNECEPCTVVYMDSVAIFFFMVGDTSVPAVLSDLDFLHKCVGYTFCSK